MAASIADSAADFNRELPKSALGVYPEGLWGYYLKGSWRYYPEGSWGYTPSEARGHTPLSRLGIPLQAVWVYPSNGVGVNPCDSLPRGHLAVPPAEQQDGAVKDCENRLAECLLS